MTHRDLINEIINEDEETLNSQDWLDENYPIEKRNNERELIIDSLSPDSTLNFLGFNNLTNLEITGKFEMLTIYSFPISLERLKLSNNNLKSTLEPFSRLINLKKLNIGIYSNYFFPLSRKKFNNYNNWTGSLKPLKNLNKLEWISLGSTDVNDGLEFLSNTVEYIELDSDYSDSKCLELKKIWIEFNENVELYKIFKFNNLNIIRLEEIFKTMEKDPNLSKIKRNNLPILKVKFFSILIEEFNRNNLSLDEFKSQNILLSNQLIEVNNDLEHYKNSHQAVIAKLRIRLPLLMNNLDNASTNNSLLSVANIEQLKQTIVALENDVDNKNYELTKFVNLIKDSEEEIINNNEKIIELETWKKANLSKLNNLETELNKTSIHLTSTQKDLKDIQRLNFESKVKLQGVLFLDSMRSIMPSIFSKGLTAIETTIFISGLTNHRKIETVGWIAMTGFITFSVLLNTYKIIKFSIFKGIEIFNLLRGKKKDLGTLKESE